MSAFSGTHKPASMNRLPHNRQPGPQIHAVPESERAVDPSGRKLPWAYDTVLSNNLNGERSAREPVEKGPFGRNRSGRRASSRSRSKTVDPQREEDRAEKEQLTAVDAVFGSMRRVAKEEGRQALGEVDANAVAQAPAVTSAASSGESEATEVLLYGFGQDLQWAAVDFYERASGGAILEDYDRTPPGQMRSYDPAHAYSRATLQRSLSRGAKRKKNQYAGGEHWIKVTFSSQQAAELACARSPHIIKGHLVYAEAYQGRGPARDEPIFATQAGAQIVSGALPLSFSTNNASPNGSHTISSATETAANGGAPPHMQSLTQPKLQTPTLSGGGSTSSSQLQPGTQAVTRRNEGTGTLRVRGAQAAVLLPAEQAFMPKPSKASWSAWLGLNELLGSAVPRKEDGSFDWDKASLYWRVFYWLDRTLGTDFCGLRDDE